MQNIDGRSDVDGTKATWEGVATTLIAVIV